jgi:hypothetical protein
MCRTSLLDLADEHEEDPERKFMFFSQRKSRRRLE